MGWFTTLLVLEPPIKKDPMKNKKQWHKPVMKEIVISMESTAYAAIV
jgi:hypothetical protein